MIQSPTSSRDYPNLTVITGVLSLMSLTTWSLLLSIAILVFVLFILNANRRRTSVTPVEDIVSRLPGPRGFIATAKLRIALLKKASTRMFHKTKTYGKLLGIGTDETTYVIIMDRASLEEAFVTKSDIFCNRGGIIKVMLESGLPERGSIFNNGTAWHESRGFVAQTTKNSDFGATTISRCIDDSIPVLYSELDGHVGRPFDPKRIYQYFFVDVFHRISFGVGISYEDDIVKQFVDDLDDVVAHTLAPSILILARPSTINTCFFRGYRSKLKSSASYVKARAEEQLINRDSSEKKSNKNSLILLFANYIEGIRSAGKASYAEPEDGWVLMYNMFFAAADTVHEVLLWLTLFLATRLDIQDKGKVQFLTGLDFDFDFKVQQNQVQEQADTHVKTVPTSQHNKLKMRAEINTLIDSVGGDISYDHRSRLPIVMSTILEVLRMRPVAPMGVPHIAAEKGSLAGYSVPKGSQLFTNIWGMHNDPDVWTDPKAFNPDRFLSDTGVLDEEKAKLVIPFSIGPRSCPGEQIARRTIFQTLVSLVRRYRMTLPAGVPPPQLVNEKRSFTMSPERYKVVFSSVQPNQLVLNDPVVTITS